MGNVTIRFSNQRFRAHFQETIQDRAFYKTNHPANKQENDAAIRKLPEDQMTYARLYQRMKVNEELFLSLTKRLNEAMITEAGVVNDVSIMSVATIPRQASPSRSIRKA